MRIFLYIVCLFAVAGAVAGEPRPCRRTVAEGELLLAELDAKYDDRASWEARREEVLRDVREALELGPFVRGLAVDPAVVTCPVAHHEGYTTQNYALETLPGLYACGTVYAPTEAGIPLPGRHMIADGRRPREHRYPLVVAPSGHWEGGRYRADHQLLMATLARMGAVVVDMDIFGWGESEMQVGCDAHKAPYAMQVQVLWSKVVTDWVVSSRDDVDTTRMAATGGSGGATHALMLAVVDPRFRVLAPVVHLVSHFDGGCPCENARPVTLAAGGSCMPEILAAVCAPYPVLTVSDGGDWTASYPTLEYPFLQRIWGFYGAREQVHNVHLATEHHDFGANKRRAVYEFLAGTLGLDLRKADEMRVDVQPEEAMHTFAGQLPALALQTCAELERIIQKLK